MSLLRSIPFRSEGRRLWQSPFFCFALIAAGIVIRLTLYLQDCSFWLDESYVAIQIVHRSWHEILRGIRLLPGQPLHPLGFIILAKLSVMLLGNHEYALRLIPLASGILSVVMFYGLLRRVVRAPAVPLALGFFAFSGPLIQFSAELKPYATDVLVTILLLQFFRPAELRENNLARAVSRGIGGGAAMWISYPSVFVLAGIGMTLIAGLWRQRRRPQLPVVIMFLLWALSFLHLYFFSFSSMMATHELFAMYDQRGFLMPRPFWSWSAMLWVKDSLLKMFVNPGGFPFPPPALLMFVSGCFYFFRSGKERLTLLLMPGALCWAAAAVRTYPFFGRMLLFFMPMMLIFIAEGCVFLIGRLPRRARWVGIAIAGILIIDFAGSLRAGVRPDFCPEDHRALMSRFEAHVRPGDFIYLANDALFPFCYYFTQMNLPERFRPGTSFRWKGELYRGFKIGRFKRDLGRDGSGPYSEVQSVYLVFNQKGMCRNLIEQAVMSRWRRVGANTVINDAGPQRAWVYLRCSTKEEREFLTAVFDRQGKRLRKYSAKGAVLYLYDLP